MTDLAELKRLAEALSAVPIELVWTDDKGSHADHEIGLLASKASAAILALIAEVERLRGKIRELSDDAGCCDGCGSTMSVDDLHKRGAISCCPERKMLSAKQWRTRAIQAEESEAAKCDGINLWRASCVEAEEKAETEFRRGLEAAAKVVRPAIEAIPMDHGERVFMLQVGEKIGSAIRAIGDE